MFRGHGTAHCYLRRDMAGNGSWNRLSVIQYVNNNNIYTPFCSKASGTSTLNSVLETFYGTKTNTLLGSAHLLRMRCAYDMFSSLTH